MGFDQLLVELQDVMGSDRRIAESAWTSSYTDKAKELKTDADVERVVRMLGGSVPPHGVPFESVVFYFWIRMPITSDRQFMTHRIQSANGMSGRYRTMPQDWYGMPDDVKEICDRLGAEKNIFEEYESMCNVSNSFYSAVVGWLRDAEKGGIITNPEFKRAREIVRGALPQANMTERTTTMNLRSFANFQKQRNDGHAAPEMQYIAQRMLEEVERCAKIPIALAVLKECGWQL